MFKTTVFLVAIASAYAAEISQSYALLEKHSTFKPDLRTEPVNNYQRDSDEHHPVFNLEEYKNSRRALIKQVEPSGPVTVDHERMLADQPAENPSEVNRIDNLQIPNYAYIPGPAEVAYPDVPYAPAYGYPNSYDMYGNSPSPYYVEPDTSVLSMLWSQVPDSRSIVGYFARTISKLIGSTFLLLVGAVLTVGVCSYTNLCTFTFNGIGPIHEEMRTLITPEKLEKIGHAAEFVKTAIDKYQKIQSVDNVEAARRRRAIFS
ncbi:hypothetical protein ABMA27_001559 [Loxostege sticticalis]|uniref:Uncharacterized protein n=1 Tax=Loxostege sticticalis TaxID=481309 RepID=A0ABR3HZ06_LOXSC